MLKTILFDLGRVIVPFDFHRGYRAMEPLCAYRAADIPARLATTDLVQRFETGLIEPRPFVEQLSSLLELRVDYPEFCEMWSSIFLPETLVPDSLIAGLKKRYRLLLLSNTNAIHFEMIRERYPILRHFDDFVLSYRVGAMKPSPLIYQRAIELARCQPEQCFFTDDIESYVDAARGHGMDAVQFVNSGQLEVELAVRGVRWD